MNSSTLLMIALFIALGYFMLVRPAQVQKRKQAALMKELEPGARVQTQIGVYGTLVEMGDVQARVEIAPDVVITIDKRLVSGMVPRSRDEFHTYPDEPADGTVEDGTVEDGTAEDAAAPTDAYGAPVPSDGTVGEGTAAPVDAPVTRAEEGAAVRPDDVSGTEEASYDAERARRAGGTDDRTA